MKINQNIPPNIEPPEFEKNPTGSTSLPTGGRQADTLEPFRGGISSLFETSFHTEANVANASFVNSFLLGSHPISFGLTLDAPAPPPEESFSFLDHFKRLLEPPVDGIRDLYDATKWLGEKAWDGTVYAIEHITAGGAAVVDGAEWVGGKVEDAVGAVADAVSDAFDW